MNHPILASLTTHAASPWGGIVTIVCGYDPATPVICGASGLLLIVAGSLSLFFDEGHSRRKVQGLSLLGAGLAFVYIRLASWFHR